MVGVTSVNCVEEGDKYKCNVRGPDVETEVDSIQFRGGDIADVGIDGQGAHMVFDGEASCKVDFDGNRDLVLECRE